MRVGYITVRVRIKLLKLTVTEYNSLVRRGAIHYGS